MSNSLNKTITTDPVVNIETQDLSDTRKSLVASFEADEVAAEHQAIVKEFVKIAKMPGFRPGKAPIAMVQKRYQKEITEEFRKKIMSKAYQSAIEDSKLEVLNVVNVEEGEITPDAPATITVTVDVQPVFDIPEWEGLPTTTEPTDASDEEVEKTLEHMRAERADFSVVEREAKKSDYVKLAYEGSIDGKPILEIAPDKQIYGKVPQTWEEVEGENEGLIPGLGKQLTGLKAGDKKDINVSFPAEFAAVEALIRNNIKQQKDGRNRSEQRRQVTEALIEKVSFHAPESLVENETQSVLRQFVDQNMRQGVSAEQLEGDKEALYANARKAGESRVVSQLILAKIAEKEKVTVEEADMNQFIYQQAMRSGQAPDKFIKELVKDRQQLRSIQQSILLDKTLDLVVSKSTVTEAAAAAE